jgi:MinD-like ATPase involved in chromosome partitioning or flagellar assembly
MVLKMLITVTAPKKGLGQTVTTINIGATFNSISKKNILLIDTNKYCRDIEYFLSDTSITRGLDNFISLNNSKLLNKDSFETCIKNVHKGIDIMASNDCLELDNSIIKTLLDYTKSLYDISVIDSNSSSSSIARLIFEQSDAILVVLNQYKHVVNMAIENDAYLENKNKVVFILNKHMGKHDEKKLKYTEADISISLKAAGFSNSMFTLDYDVDIVNDCNEHSVLNYINGSDSKKRRYTKQINELVTYVQVNFSNETNKNESQNIRRPVKKSFFGLLKG